MSSPVWFTELAGLLRVATRRFFSIMSSTNRTVFLVDGFNVYHSLREAENDLGQQSVKWLDLHSLLSSYLPIVGAGAKLERIYYFSALALHLDARKPGVTARHRSYIECLQSTGVMPVLGRFKYKEVYCRTCKKEQPHYEEKETDVAISVKLVELFSTDKADTIVLVTGDTDLVPAISTTARLFPAKEICMCFPYKRKSQELAKMVSKHFRIKKDRYLAHQFPDPVVLTSGKTIPKPLNW